MSFVDVAKTFLIAVPIGITALDVFGYVARVDGSSMQPALNPPSQTQNDYVFLNRFCLRFKNVDRGDVVSFMSPKDPEQRLIKRIIGLEGDIISTINYKEPVVKVPKGHCWVEGDNTGNSFDSNIFGPIALALITGKASAIVWPPWRWQTVRSHVPSSRTPAIAMQMEY